MTNPIQRLRPFAVGALTALLVAIFAVPSAAATQQGECSRYTDHSGHVPATYDYARFVEYDKDGHVIYDATFDVPQGGLYVDPQKAEYGNKSWDRVWKCKRSPTTTTVPPTTTTTEVPPSSTTTIPSTTSTSTPPTTTSTTSTTSSSSTSTTTTMPTDTTTTTTAPAPTSTVPTESSTTTLPPPTVIDESRSGTVALACTPTGATVRVTSEAGDDYQGGFYLTVSVDNQTVHYADWVRPADAPGYVDVEAPQGATVAAILTDGAGLELDSAWFTVDCEDPTLPPDTQPETTEPPADEPDNECVDNAGPDGVYGTDDDCGLPHTGLSTEAFATIALGLLATGGFVARLNRDAKVVARG